MEFKLKSVKTVVYRALRDLGIADKEVDWQSQIEWAMEALQLIDGYTQYIEVLNYPIEIENHIAKLPMDFYAPIQNQCLEYKLQGDCIVTNKKNGKIMFNYLAFPLDDEGFLMIPDNISYDEALKWRIAMMLSIRGELTNPNLNLKYCEDKWNWYCRQARAVSNMLDADAVERFAQNRIRFKPDLGQYATNFWRVDNKVDRRK